VNLDISRCYLLSDDSLKLAAVNPNRLSFVRLTGCLKVCMCVLCISVHVLRVYTLCLHVCLHVCVYLCVRMCMCMQIEFQPCAQKSRPTTYVVNVQSNPQLRHKKIKWPH